MYLVSEGPVQKNLDKITQKGLRQDFWGTFYLDYCRGHINVIYLKHSLG